MLSVAHQALPEGGGVRGQVLRLDLQGGGALVQVILFNEHVPEAQRRGAGVEQASRQVWRAGRPTQGQERRRQGHLRCLSTFWIKNVLFIFRAFARCLFPDETI